MKELVKALPEEVWNSFMRTDIPLRIEYIIGILKGHTGLYREIEKTLPHDDVSGGGKAANLEMTLEYLESLAANLPDEDIASQVTGKIDNLIIKIKNQRVEQNE
jgi:hypothetical protein